MKTPLIIKHFLAEGLVGESPLLTITDPFTSDIGAYVVEGDHDTVNRAVMHAQIVQKEIAHIPTYQRAQILQRVGVELLNRKEEVAEGMALLTGKTIREARTEVDRSADILVLSGEEARRNEGLTLPADALPSGRGRVAFTIRVPVGVVVGITAFNAPLSIACHKVGPSFAAGNATILKPDPRGAFAGVVLAELFAAAGAPAGSVQVVQGGAKTGEALVRHTGVDLVNFTGSTRAGEAIISMAGLKRVLLELGGNAATIVHHDADLKSCIEPIAQAAFGLAGQSCISLQRLFVHESIYERFVLTLVDRASHLRVGSPFDPSTDVGPLVSDEAAERLQEWIDQAVAAGARLLCGGQRTGRLFPPTILEQPPVDQKIVCEEVFGPVVSIFPYREINEAIGATNASRFGLQAGVFTASLDVALRVAYQMEVGGVIVNGPSRYRLDHLPYGGVKRSGIGREGPRFAIEDMTHVKTVVMSPAGGWGV